MSLIHLYGEFWNPDAVAWGAPGRRSGGGGNKGTLMGELKLARGASATLDFRDACGVYALYDNFRLVYVGQAFQGARGCLGKRLRDHLADCFAWRWDKFSWYSTSSIRDRSVRAAGARRIAPDTVVDTLEAFAIAIASPPLNRRNDGLPGARPVEPAKSRHPHTVRHCLETILKQLEKPAPTAKRRK